MAVVENDVSNNHVESNNVASQSESPIMISRSINGNQNHEDSSLKKEIRDLEDMLSKSNLMAEEFMHALLSNNGYNGVLLQSPSPPAAAQFGYASFRNINDVSIGRKKGGYTNGKRRMNSTTNLEPQEDASRRTIHVSEID